MESPIQQLSRLAHDHGLTVGVAESLTSGLLASEVGKGEGAQEWFSGGVVAYQMPVKVQVLGVRDGVDPCSAECATALAVGARSLLETDIAVATTGVGGPDSEDGHPAGTVYLGWATRDGSGADQLQLDGGPEDVLSATVDHALQLLVTLAERESVSSQMQR
jgi:nicotinamide-nucleotide amidase